MYRPNLHPSGRSPSDRENMGTRSKVPAWKNRQERPNIVSGAKTVGYYSVDGDRNYLPDSSRLLYYKPPEGVEVTLDLDDGIEKAVRRKDSFKAEGISLLLKWIKAHREEIEAPPETDRLIQPNFVCSRGLLIRLMMAPFSPNETWKIWAAKWKGTIYLRADKSRPTLYEINGDMHQRYTSWGHKFEQYVLSESPDKAPDTTKPVIEPEEFRCVYQYHFAKHSVLFSTVMKGVCSKKVLEDPLPLHKLKFVDLKTSKMIEHAGHEKTLRKHKFLKWWIMGFLTNTEKVLCGYRDEIGIVNKLIPYNLDQMVAMSRSYWNPEECIRCCETFLSKLEDTVVNECDETIYEFNKVSHEDFNITELVPSEEISVLPQSYMDAMG